MHYRLEHQTANQTDHFTLRLENWTYRWSAGSSAKDRGQGGLVVTSSDGEAAAAVAAKIKEKFKVGFVQISAAPLPSPSVGQRPPHCLSDA